MHHHIDLCQRLRNHAVHHAVHVAAMARLEARGIDKHKLLMLARKHTVYAVAGGLRLAGHDRDLDANQGDGNRGLAYVRPAHYGDEDATKRYVHLYSWVTATGKESCAYLRARERPAPLAGFR